MPARLELDAAELERLYLVEKLSTKAIAERLGLKYPTTVLRHLKRNGVQIRSNSEASSLRKQTPEHVEKRTAQIRGRVSPMKGRKLTEEQRETKRRLWQDPEYRAHMEAVQRGEKHYRWKGGSKTGDLRRSAWIRIRNAVYERDGWCCQECGVQCSPASKRSTHGKTTIQAHHIVGRRDGGEDTLENLVTLCMSCHQRLEHTAESAAA